MAKRVTIDNIRDDGHATITFTDDDDVSVTITTRVDPSAPENEVLDEIMSRWPDGELASKRGDLFQARRKSLMKLNSKGKPQSRDITESLDDIRARVKQRQQERAK